MATLKDLAKEAGVSVMTVSNVINGKHNKVSAQTISRINELVEKHHFIPNQTARNLVGKSSHIIGLIVPYIQDTVTFDMNPYYSHMIGALEHRLRSEDYYLLLRSVSSLQEASVILKSWNVDGAIFMGSFNDEILQSNHFNPIPLIFIDNYTPHENITNVGLNDYHGEFQAVSYLIEQGHKHIAYVSPDFSRDKPSVFERRFAGYRDALLVANLPFSEDYVYSCPINHTSGIALTRHILTHTKEVTAICTAADIIALGIMEGARNLNITLPEELSIFGFDNLMATDFVNPKLSSVAQNVREKADLAASLLLEQLQQKTVTSKHLVLDLTLSLKESVAPPRASSTPLI